MKVKMRLNQKPGKEQRCGESTEKVDSDGEDTKDIDTALLMKVKMKLM